FLWFGALFGWFGSTEGPGEITGKALPAEVDAARGQSQKPVAPAGDDSRAGRLRDRGFLSIGEQASRINFDARFSQALERFQHEYPAKEILVISPVKEDALLFERSFLSYRDRIHLLRAGYVSVMALIEEQFDGVCAQFARRGMAVSRARFEERATQRLARLDPVGSTSVVRVAPAALAPAHIGGVGAAWRKAK
ncbi:MAG: hypothetical protein HUU21_38505, partial [Polyangiaceae bacterium]|nr:hypothetical protein [Polyangiaceae bacterium]